VTADDGAGCEGFAYTGQSVHCNGPSVAVSDPIQIEVQTLPRLGLAVALERPQSLRGLEVSATCRNLDCDAKAHGRIRVKYPGAKPMGFKLSAKTLALTAEQAATLSAGIPATARRAARKALAVGGRVRATLRVAARALGDQRRVRLRRVRIAG